jgi:hypothetical protein
MYNAVDWRLNTPYSSQGALQLYHVNQNPNTFQANQFPIRHLELDRRMKDCDGTKNLLTDIGIASILFGFASLFNGLYGKLNLGVIFEPLFPNLNLRFLGPSLISTIKNADLNVSPAVKNVIVKGSESVLRAMSTDRNVGKWSPSYFLGETLGAISLALAIVGTFPDLWIHDIERVFGRQAYAFVQNYGCFNQFI